MHCDWRYPARTVTEAGDGRQGRVSRWTETRRLTLRANLLLPKLDELTYFCETANVVEPFRPVLRSNVVTGADRVPWNEYLPPVPLTPLSVILPINCPVAALYRVRTSDDTWLVASTFRLRFFTTSSALVMAGKSIVWNRVAVKVDVAPLSVAEYVIGVSAATGLQVMLKTGMRFTCVKAGRT